MEAGPPPQPHAPVADREPLSLGEIREIWPLLALSDRIQAFLLLPRDEAEDFFFGLPARDQADVVLGVPAREQRSWLRSLPPDDAADLIQAAPMTKREAAAAAAGRGDPPRGDGAARLLGGQRGRADEPALRAGPPRHDRRRGDQLRAQADARADAHHLLRVRARQRAEADGRGVVQRAVQRVGARARRRHHAHAGDHDPRADGPGDGGDQVRPEPPAGAARRRRKRAGCRAS